MKLLQSRLDPAQFKAVMQKALDYHEPIQKDVKADVKLLSEGTKAYEKYNAIEKEGWNGKTIDRTTNKTPGGNPRAKMNNKKYRNEEGARYGNQNSDRTLYLNPACDSQGKNYWTRTECDIT